MCIYYCMIILIKYLIIFGNFNLLKKKKQQKSRLKFVMMADIRGILFYCYQFYCCSNKLLSTMNQKVI